MTIKADEYTHEQEQEFLRLSAYSVTRWRNLIDNNHYTIDDIYSTAMLGVTQAINSFEIDGTAKFSTYAICCIDNEMLKLISTRRTKKRRGKSKTVSLEYVMYTGNGGNDIAIIDNLDAGIDIFEEVNKCLEDGYLLSIVEKLSEKDRYLLGSMLGIMGYPKKTQRELAIEEGVKRGTISARYRALITRIQKKVNENKLYS